MQQKTKTPIFVAWSIFAWLGFRFNATFNNVGYSIEYGGQFYWCLMPLSTM
jgi:hypothetical protein